MIKFVILIFIVAIFVKCGESRNLWEPSLPEIPATLEKNKPIQLEGNYDKLQIASLRGTIYSDSLSQLHNVSELRLVRSQIREIENGALCSAPKLKVLELDLSGNRQPPTLTKDMFSNCNLTELFLKFDYSNPSIMDQDALVNLTLDILAIDSLVVPHLKKNGLQLQNEIKTLVLSNIHLETIDSDVFEDLNNLKELEIVHNIELKNLPKNLFQNSKKLKRLVLKDNAIVNLTWDEFQGLSSLEELDLSDNQINNVDVDKIVRDLPKLKKFYVQLNPVEISKEIMVELNTKLNRTVEMANRRRSTRIACEELN